MPVKKGSQVGGPLTQLAEENKEMEREFARMSAEYSQKTDADPVNEWIVPEKCSPTFTSKDGAENGDAEWVVPKEPLLRNEVDVSFTVLWKGGGGGSEKHEIQCAGPKPAVHALSDSLNHVTELREKLGRVYLVPEVGSKFKGEPNVGVPARSLDGGVFRLCFYGDDGKHKAAQLVSAHTEEELLTKQRCAVYVSDAHKDCMAAAYGLKKEKADVDAAPLMVDVLPGETLLRALYRDARFDNAMVNRFVATKADSPESGNQLMTSGADLHDVTLVLKLAEEEEVTDEEAEAARDPDGRVLSRCLAPFLIGKDLGEYAGGSGEGAAEGIGEDGAGLSGKEYWDMRRTLQEVRDDIEGFDVDKILADLQDELSRTDFDKRTNIAGGKIDATGDAFELISMEKAVNEACESDPICQDGIPGEMQYSLVQHFNSVGVVGFEDTAIGGGFRLGSRYLLTCHHMVEAIREMAQRKEPDTDAPPPLEHAHVEFHHYTDELQPMTYTRFKFKADPVHEDADTDFCILELQVEGEQSDLLQTHLPGLGNLLPPKEASGEAEVTSTAGKVTKQDDNPASVRTGGQVMFWRSGSPGFDPKGRLTVMSRGTRPMYKNSPTTVLRYVSVAAVRDLLYGLAEKGALQEGVVRDMFPLE
ncbi:Hypp5804 [Branchiostoma lanceolatum]|uniref:Hypp5804 protein n=1 Tax=Branchiostoma lanceolatum TaxID=7740 RepID=A0A8J9YSG2_BRALA|nr:Hypp5804 [Branchiostoma lanceolatum]